MLYTVVHKNVHFFFLETGGFNIFSVFVHLRSVGITVIWINLKIEKNVVFH